MRDDSAEFQHPFLSMELKSVKIPDILTLADLGKGRKKDLFIGDLYLGPRASKQIQKKYPPLVLSYLSASAHNDLLRQKIVVSLHREDAEEEYEKLTTTKKGTKNTKIENHFGRVVEEKASGKCKEALLKVQCDAKKVALIRHLFAHGVFGRATALKKCFLVFEPPGLTEAHAKSTTFDHNTDYPFAKDPMKQANEAFNMSLPDADKITVWDKTKLKEALEACHYVQCALSTIIECLRPHPNAGLRAKPEEFFEVYAEYGAVVPDLRMYFRMRELYEIEKQFQGRSG